MKLTLNIPSNFKSFRCQCNEGMCGPECSLYDPCQDNELSPCMNGAMCTEACTVYADYKCQCLEGFAGKNCSEPVRKKFQRAFAKSFLKEFSNKSLKKIKVNLTIFKKPLLTRFLFISYFLS